MSIQQILQPSAQNEPWSKVYVNAVSTNAFKLSTNPVSSYVLTSDASGNGTWQAADSDVSSTYASVGYVSSTGQALTIDTTPTVLSTNSNVNDAVSSNMTVDATGIVCTLGGDYLINASFSVANQDTSDLLSMWVASSGVASNQVVYSPIVNGTIVNVNFTTIMYVSAGNRIQIFGSAVASNRACTVFSWNISATKMF